MARWLARWLARRLARLMLAASAMLATCVPLANAQIARPAEDGYDLWLRYRLVSNATRLVEYRATITRVVVEGAAASPTLRAARMELITGLSGLLGRSIDAGTTLTDGAIVVGTPASSRLIAGTALAATVRPLARDGYAIRATTVRGRHVIVVVGNTNVGALYGAFRLLRQIQTNASLVNLAITDAPRVQLRMLDHWDNLDRTIERGYAGQSLWDWHAPSRFAPVNGPAIGTTRAPTRRSASTARSLTNVNADAQGADARRISRRSRRWPTSFARTASGSFSRRGSARRSRSAA